jgi:hypothetical protein
MSEPREVRREMEGNILEGQCNDWLLLWYATVIFLDREVK